MLLGSTEWVETHADELRQHAAVYINSDGNGRGVLNMGGSHSLEQFINGVARDIEDPEAKMSEDKTPGNKMSVWQRAQLSKIAKAKSPENPKDDPKELRKELRQRHRPAHRRAGLGNRLHGVSRPPRHRHPRSGIRRRGRRGDLSLHLRRFLLVHTFLG